MAISGTGSLHPFRRHDVSLPGPGNTYPDIEWPFFGVTVNPPNMVALPDCFRKALVPCTRKGLVARRLTIL